MLRHVRTGIVIAAVLLFATSANAAETKSTPFKGATRIHRTGVNVGGATQDYHVVIVDLAEPTLRVAVSPQVDRNEVTSAIAKKHQAKLAVNGSFFSYADREPCGATEAAGKFWTNAYSGCAATMAFGPGQAALVSTGNDKDGPLPAAASFALDAISGKPWVLKNGQSTGPWTDPDHINTRNPRTAIGVGDNGKKVIVLVADGRRTGAAGMVGTDLVTVMKEFGATDAMNLDGGGSTTLYLPNGVANKPSDGTERAVSNAVMIVPAAPVADAGAEAGPDATVGPEAETPDAPAPASAASDTTTESDATGPSTASPESEADSGCSTSPDHPQWSMLFVAGAIVVALRRRRFAR